MPLISKKSKKAKQPIEHKDKVAFAKALGIHYMANGGLSGTGTAADPMGLAPKTGTGADIMGGVNTVLDPLNINPLNTGALNSLNPMNSFTPSYAPIMAGTSGHQLANSYGQAASGINQQQDLVNALAAQNGLQNQQAALGQLGNVNNQLGGLYNQYGQVAAGQGPNPAQAMLSQATGQNVANQAALMAGQRGAGANVGLMARQIAQQGANTQQQAAGQGATLQANQSLNAMGQQAGVLGQQAGIANAYGQIAGQQVGNQIGAVGNLNNYQQGEQQQLQNSNSQYNNALISQQNAINASNAAVAAQNSQTKTGLLGGIMGAAGSATSALFAHGGKVGYADGGEVQGSSMPPNMDGPQSNVGKYLSGQMADATPAAPGVDLGGQSGDKQQGPDPMKTVMSLAPLALALLNKGGKVPAMVSPGEVYLPPEKAKAVARGHAIAKRVGETIPGKAKVPGDSEANDIVPKTLEKGGVVLPRTVAKKDSKAQANFVMSALSKNLR